jgi:hypothetical protein
MLKILSLGAGVQSSTLAFMIAKGEVPMVDYAIFADTGAEPEYVYSWLDYVEQNVPFPVLRVIHKEGLLRNIEDSVNLKTRIAQPPFFAKKDGRPGPLMRACTSEFKVGPIIRKVRELCGLKKGERAGKGVRAIQYIGISWDEVQRMKPSREAWIQHEWPLIDRKMTRSDCLKWMSANGYPLPQKSSCTFCPYHSDEMWRDMKLNDQKSWDQAVYVDKLIRNGVRGTTQDLYLHRSLKPLEEVDLRNASDFGQVDAFGNECEGMCGV